MSLEIVKSVRVKYPTPLGSEHARFLLEVARVLGWGLVRKPSGTRIVLPDGVSVSQDVVMLPDGTARDILFDGEGEARAIWNDSPTLTPDRYYAVIADAPEVPPETPPETPSEPSELETLIASILVRLEKLENAEFECSRSAFHSHTVRRKL